jgi:hypothetical protein
METNSAALLMCSPEGRERHFRKEHIDFLKQRWIERTVLQVGHCCF